MQPDDSASTLRPLLDRHRAGDPAAAGVLLTRCQERLRVLTRRMLRNFPGVRRWEDSDDVFQDVQLKLLSALRRLTFRSTADFLQLAACQIRRRLIDLTRKRHPDGGPSGADGRPDPPAAAEDPYELAAWQEFHTRIDGLPADDRRLFDLLYYQGLSLLEVSGLLGIPPRTLNRRWRDLRERVGRLLRAAVPF